MNMRNHAVVVGLAATLALGTLAPAALASPQSELAEAAERLDTLGGELTSLEEDLAQKSEALERTSYKIGEKTAQIDQTQEELDEARSVLGGRMRSTYKSGSTSLLAVFLGADSLNDLVSRIYYLDKVATSDAEAIAEVKALEERLDCEKADLEKTKARQEKAVGELQGQVSDYQAKVAEAQQYYDALDAEVQAQIAAEQAAENARIQAALAAAEEQKAQEEAAKKAEREAARKRRQEQEQEQAQEQQEQEEQEEVEPEQEQEQQEESPEEEPETTDDEGTSRAVPGYGGLSTAYAAIGCPYVYGAAGPSSFDCSGLVCYCYGWSRGRTTYDMIASLKADGAWKTSMSQLAVGDLVFTHEGHVGIYVGGGEMIHAPTPGRSVCQAPVYSFIGGGTF